MPMSYTRVLVIETPLSRAAFMKTVRNTEEIFKKLKKDKILNSYKFIEAGVGWFWSSTIFRSYHVADRISPSKRVSFAFVLV